MAEEIPPQIEALVRVIEGLQKEMEYMRIELKTEILEMRTEMKEGLAAVRAELRFHGKMIASGTRAMASLIEWSNRVDERFNNIEARVAKLEFDPTKNKPN